MLLVNWWSRLLWSAPVLLAAGHPKPQRRLAQPVSTAPSRSYDYDVALTTPQRVNIGLVLLYSMSLQILAVSVAMGLLFLAFGMLVIPTSTAKSFLGDGAAPTALNLENLPFIRDIQHATFMGQPIEITRELVVPIATSGPRGAAACSRPISGSGNSAAKDLSDHRDTNRGS